jgi:hypothetical protein
LICKPEKRLTAEEALAHKWMKRHIKKLENVNFSGAGLDNFKNFTQNNELK